MSQPTRVIIFILSVMLLGYWAWPLFFQPFHWTTDPSTYSRLDSRVVRAVYFTTHNATGTDLILADFNDSIYCPQGLSGCRHLDKNLRPGEAVKVLYHCQRHFNYLVPLFGERCGLAELDTANGFSLVTLKNAVANHARSIRIGRIFTFSMLFMLFLMCFGPLMKTYAARRFGGNEQSEKRLS